MRAYSFTRSLFIGEFKTLQQEFKAQSLGRENKELQRSVVEINQDSKNRRLSGVRGPESFSSPEAGTRLSDIVGFTGDTSLKWMRPHERKSGTCIIKTTIPHTYCAPNSGKGQHRDHSRGLHRPALCEETLRRPSAQQGGRLVMRLSERAPQVQQHVTTITHAQENLGPTAAELSVRLGQGDTESDDQK